MVQCSVTLSIKAEMSKSRLMAKFSLTPRGRSPTNYSWVADLWMSILFTGIEPRRLKRRVKRERPSVDGNLEMHTTVYPATPSQVTDHLKLTTNDITTFSIPQFGTNRLSPISKITFPKRYHDRLQDLPESNQGHFKEFWSVVAISLINVFPTLFRYFLYPACIYVYKTASLLSLWSARLVQDFLWTHRFRRDSHSSFGARTLSGRCTYCME